MSPALVRTLCLLALPAALFAQAPDSTRRDTTTRATPLSSGARMTRARLDSLPIDDQATAIAQIPGVFLRGSDVGISPGGALSIRGGLANGAATFIDGAPVRSFLSGTAFIQPALNGIAGIDVTTGLAGAELSDIQNGVISYETSSGGDRFQSHWSAHTDQPFGSVASVGYNRFAGDVSGPVPGVRGLTFFASGFVEGQSSEYLGFGAQNVPTFEMGGLDTTVQVNTGSGTANVTIPRFVQVSGSCNAGANGADCQGITRPFDWRTGLQFAGKVRWEYRPGSSIAVTGLADGLQLREFPGTALGDPALFSGAHEWTRLAVVNWHQRISASVAADAVMSVGSDYLLTGALDPASETSTRDPSLGIELSSLDFSSFGSLGVPLDQQIIKNFRTNSGLRVPLLGQTQLNNSQPYRMNPYAMASGGLYTQGVDAPLALASERQRTGRWQVEWTPDQRQAITVGVDADGADLTNYQAASPIRQVFTDVWTASPSRLGWFGQDVILIGPATVEAGLRYDRVNPGVELSNTPGFTFSDPDWDQTSATNPAAYAASVAKVFTPTRNQSFLSPRLRMAVALDPATSLHADVGQILVTAPVAAVAANSNNDLTFTNLGVVFGRDVSDGKATSFELGGRRRFGSTTSVDVSGYYVSHIPTFEPTFQNFVDPSNPGRTLPFNVLAEFSDLYSWGLDVGAAHQVSSWFAGSATYSVQISGFKGGLPGSAITTQQIATTLQLAAPDAWAADGWRSALRRVAAVVQFQMINGLPYTPLENQGGGEIAPGENFLPGSVPSGDFFSQRLPWTKALDLRLTKGVHASGLDWTIFADFRNLLNFKNLYALFAETGSPTNPLVQQRVESGEFAALANEAANNGARLGNGSVSLGNCGGWQGQAGPVDCVMLERAEARFGNGDGVYTLAEQQRAFDAYYDMIIGSYQFYGPQRTVRVGLELAF